MVYHVLNRGNGRMRLFHKPGDYDAFVGLLGEVQKSVPVRILGYCLMPNHWHLVLWPERDGELPRFMQRLSTAHVRRRHAHYHADAGGHLYQGRYKSFPVQQDEHLLAVLRYVEANPIRAKLSDRADG
jgi:putative transposase